MVRITGTKSNGQLDTVWKTFLVVIQAEIGLTLVAVTAFRTFYISKAKSRNVQKTITTLNWYHKGRSAALFVLRKATGKTYSTDVESKEGPVIGNDIPHATLTGIRTMIDEAGQSSSSSMGKEDV